MRSNRMRKEYDFSKGERGKFHKPNAKLNVPVYLEPDVLGVVERVARKRRTDVSAIVNELLKADIQQARALK